MNKIKLIFSAAVLITFFIYLFSSNPKLEKELRHDETPPIDESVIVKMMPSHEIKVYNHDKDELMDMDFEEYLVGVLAGEMPASYEIAALSAQSVAARSFILSRMEYYRKAGTPPEHKGADVCTYYGHCQAWRSVADFRAGWGAENADIYENKLRTAVTETRGQYLVYDGKIAKTFFYSMSSGKSENVEDVWGGDSEPYLISVSSEGDKTAPNFETCVEVGAEEFRNKLKEKRGDIIFSDVLSQDFGELTRTDGGSIATITIGGEKFKGTEIRTIFKLRSANFEVSTDDSAVYFAVKGYGHGVGLSQYGANYLAGQGKDYKEILSTYYPGTEIATE